ncbi:hypothetical protein RI844_17130 [Thalassotalea fonticola]|uniref:Cellobiose phosphorylase n=1 Tax=Thalassotalea fonticola TaxID=3065649 RepID=A0ABZ0GNV7_9GAMM|nr:hypothetical protein RI844_17130 [Colwelliaceae bacterium S1-1]
MNISNKKEFEVAGEFVTLAGERYYAIRNMDKMDPFFISVISNSDHWLFVSSTGGLTAGRVSPETALFPYVTVDKIHESNLHTGSKTLFKVEKQGQTIYWEPFNREHDKSFNLTRNIYKNVLGNKLCFEEINHDLNLTFRYTWLTSDQYGFVRKCELVNSASDDVSLELIDGLQNILPAGTPRFTQTNSSNLVDAYKWSEVDAQTGLAFFTLFSGITDRAEPCESLKANTVFCLGLDNAKVLLSNEQLEDFRAGEVISSEDHKRGIRGAYLVNTEITLAAGATQSWQLVANVELSQGQAVAIRQKLKESRSNSGEFANDIENTISQGSDDLARIMASGDAFQLTGEEHVAVHHYANVQFNLLRGGAFDDQYTVSSKDFSQTISLFNSDVYLRHQAMLLALPEKIGFAELLATIKEQNDAQLERLCYEYLPISFGRRHGDPSRPWNQFAIKLVDEHNNKLLTYQGNWRDIFQNWEALTFSYPEFIENVISKFVNASTIDGYNPYRITKEGIDWEVEDESDPWSYIGYWGDHQIIYLQKMLELSQQFHPSRLTELLRNPIFSYANVPYRIKPFADLLENAKDTVTYDDDLAMRIEQLVEKVGADGKLIQDQNDNVYLVNLFEKLLVTLLSKLGNFVVDGGIWLNTQRPEWNDANNALVGQGLSMVTLSYLRRYICFLQELISNESDSIAISTEVSQWFAETAEALAKLRPLLGSTAIGAEQRYLSIAELGNAASRYRQTVYQQETFSGQVSEPINAIKSMLADALAAIDHTVLVNQRDDGLYNAYNLLDIQTESMNIDSLYPMLEGQVAALSAGTLSPKEVISVVESLFASDVYRADQQTFMLYPDRQLPSFLEKNTIAEEQFYQLPVLPEMLALNDKRIVEQDVDGTLRFNAEFGNASDLAVQIDLLAVDYGEQLVSCKTEILDLYESVFNHQEFTGRSGGMFGFEGLGCIYWHMVAKLLLAVEENVFNAIAQGEPEAVCHKLAQLYYAVREGIGFNKTPAEYGAFPTDPYSHTPKHAGAQQPGMTGQVKEEILARYGEFGIRVDNGCVQFMPYLLRKCEFLSKPDIFRYLDVSNNWQELPIAAQSLAFTWCQVPIVYRLDDNCQPSIIVSFNDGTEQVIPQLALPENLSSELFAKNGCIQQLTLVLGSKQLFAE